MSFEPLPGVAAVDGAIQSAARPAAVEAPRRAVHLPRGGEQRVGVLRVEDDVNAAGLVIDEQNFLPGGAAVGGAINAALGAGCVHMSQGRDVDDVRVRGVNDDGADLPRIRQADMGPVLPAVHRLPHAVAVGNVAADAGLAGADVERVVVGVGDRDGADRGERLFIGERLPGRARVVGLPHAAGDASEIERAGLARHAGDRHNAAAAIRTDASPLHPAEERLVVGLGKQYGSETHKQQDGDAPEHAYDPPHEETKHRSTRHGEKKIPARRPGRVQEVMSTKNLFP